jgi:hypothetical protein
MDCAGRAQRRRRFRTHHDPVNLSRGSHAQSGVALRLPPHSKTRSGESTRPLDCGDLSPLSLHRPNGPARVPAQRSVHSRRVAKAASCRRTPNTPGKPTRPLDCAGRAERRRRFRTHHDPGNFPRRSRAQSGVALRLPPQSKHARQTTRPMDCGDMSPLSLHRQNGPGVCAPAQHSVPSPLAAKAASCRRTPSTLGRIHAPYGLR